MFLFLFLFPPKRLAVVGKGVSRQKTFFFQWAFLRVLARQPADKPETSARCRTGPGRPAFNARQSERTRDVADAQDASQQKRAAIITLPQAPKTEDRTSGGRHTCTHIGGSLFIVYLRDRGGMMAHLPLRLLAVLGTLRGVAMPHVPPSIPGIPRQLHRGGVHQAQAHRSLLPAVAIVERAFQGGQASQEILQPLLCANEKCEQAKLFINDGAKTLCK